MVVFALISCATLDFTRPVPRDLAVLCLFILQYLKYELFNSYMSSQFFAVQLKTGMVYFWNICVVLANKITALWPVVFIL